MQTASDAIGAWLSRPPVEIIPPARNASPLRRLAEYAARGITLRSRLPKAYGARPIYISPANALQFMKPGTAKFDPLLLWLVDRFVRPGMVVWDIGANGGIFTTAAATIAKTVVAFEPDPFNVGLLSRTKRANPDLDVWIAPVAISDRQGSTQLHIPKRGRSVASIAGIPMGGETGGLRKSVPVDTTTLDECLRHYPIPAFIKCDIEGAEALMLRAGHRLLSEVRPTMSIEVRDSTEREVAAHLLRHDYRLFSADEAMQPLSDLYDACDVLAVPN